MRILHVNDVANVATTLATAQRSLGHEVDVLRLRLVAGSGPTALKLLALPLRSAELMAVHRQIRDRRYDVVHIHYAYLGLVGALGRHRYVLHCHGTDVRLGLHDWIRRPAVIAALNRAALVLVATPDLIPIVRAIRPDAAFVPDPVNIDLFAPDINPATDDVLLNAALSDVKRTDIAFEAIRRLRALRPGLTVTAVDHGPGREKYKGEPGIRFVPPVAHDAMPGLVRQHRVVLGQFGIGSLGMAELESMACERPVICHFNQGPAYPAAPPVLSAQDPADVAAHALRLLDERAAAVAMGAAARGWVVGTHGSEAIAKQVDLLYERALDPASDTAATIGDRHRHHS